MVGWCHDQVVLVCIYCKCSLDVLLGDESSRFIVVGFILLVLFVVSPFRVCVCHEWCVSVVMRAYTSIHSNDYIVVLNQTMWSSCCAEHQGAFHKPSNLICVAKYKAAFYCCSFVSSALEVTCPCRFPPQWPSLRRRPTP